MATCRPYRSGSAAVARNRSTIAGLMGERGALFEQIPEERELDAWAAAHIEQQADDEADANPLRISLRLLRWQVARTHSGVSERWLRRYAGEHQHRHNEHPRRFLEASIQGRRLRFADIRPEFEPGWRAEFLTG